MHVLQYGLVIGIIGEIVFLLYVEVIVLSLMGIIMTYADDIVQEHLFWGVYLLHYIRGLVKVMKDLHYGGSMDKIMIRHKVIFFVNFHQKRL